MGVGAQIACVPRRFASRGGCSHRQGWGPSALCWGFRRCPTDAFAPVRPFGAVLQTPVSRWGPSASSYVGFPRSLLSMCLWAHWSTTGGTAWKLCGSRGGGDMET